LKCHIQVRRQLRRLYIVGDRRMKECGGLVQRSWWENTEELRHESTPMVPFFRNNSLGLNPSVRGEEPAKSTTYETYN